MAAVYIESNSENYDEEMVRNAARYAIRAEIYEHYGEMISIVLYSSFRAVVHAFGLPQQPRAWNEVVRGIYGPKTIGDFIAANRLEVILNPEDAEIDATPVAYLGGDVIEIYPMRCRAAARRFFGIE